MELTFYKSYLLLIFCQFFLGKNKCPEPDGVFAVPKRATAYLNCSNNVATLMNCPRGEEWTDDKKSCGTG